MLEIRGNNIDLGRPDSILVPQRDLGSVQIFNEDFGPFYFTPAELAEPCSLVPMGEMPA